MKLFGYKINIFRYIAKMKNFGMRTMQYASYINSLLILMTFLSVRGYDNISTFTILPFLIGIVLVIGYLDYKFIMKEEISHMNAQNNIKKDLEKIKRKLEIE